MNWPTSRLAERLVAKGSSSSFNTIIGKCEVHYENAITCIEKFGRTITKEQRVHV
jgi:hypothetical protein